MNGYAAGVDELEELSRDRRVHTLVDTLMYRACGVSAFTGACTKRRWVDAALARARRLGMQPAACGGERGIRPRRQATS